MTRFLPAAAVLLLAASLVACAPAPEPAAFRPVASVKELMNATVQPAAAIYWQSVSTTVTKDGVEEKFPKNDEEWNAVWGAAITVAESGNLMMLAPRAKDGDREWLTFSSQLVAVGELAAKAARSKNPEAVLEAGEKVYDVCTRCHMKYIVNDAAS